ncbi:fanconi-associated nuclease 1 [Aspergillus chevalieri]|uniref:Fanconi-associated nuclease n=1 Tax=Aspergillus chevalieri TaxID=182096 RepID=A0A7R7VUR6_ASPCH|nr:uncharacterized protein ACHE_60901A [Aspergillus chevalieri]BCR91015.1 hypothetical protein ACHE_60901A [Aspergillus chevalieri]
MSLLDYWGKQGSSVKRRKVSGDDQKEDNVLREKSSIDRASLETDSPAIPLDGDIPADENQPPNSQTELESSLPAIETDNQTIDEYGTSHAVQDEPDLRQRMQNSTWQKGKSSIYVDAFNLALETVLTEEAHLFNDVEMEVFRQWKELSYEAQYLYVRLFLRKTSAWHRINQLGYPDIGDLDASVAELQRGRGLPVLSEAENANPADVESNSELNGEFTFADSSESITTLEEASSLLLLDELKSFATDVKVQGKSKKELLMAFRQSTQTQTGLDWNPGKTGARSPSVYRDSHYVEKILDYTGDCIKLSAGPRVLFERVHLVFYRSTEWTEKSLTTIILAKTSRKSFPSYIVCRSNSIFPSRSTLLEFESALRTQFEIDNILQFNGPPDLQRVKYLCGKVYPRWKELLAQEQQKEATLYECGEGAYLRRFSPAWVYTRIIHKGLHPLGRFKEHKQEHEILTELLDQRLFHAARRGGWYQRKALLEEHYMWNLSPFDGRSEENQRKHWKRIALRTCEEGLEDSSSHLIYHYDLQKRVMKLEKALKVPKREQHDFGYAVLAKPAERTVDGIRIEQEDTPRDNGSKRGRPTIWVDEKEGSECRVEQVCLNWYMDHGWKGYHSEGGIVRTLFGLLFYDILFTYIPNVFQTPFQTSPLDLHTDTFYLSRASEINYRLVEITNGAAEKLIRTVYTTHSPRQPCAVGINWSFPLEDLVEIAQCFRGEALATICKVLAQEYQQRGGGIPDLILWSAERREVMFVEVKSENDRLSDTQRLWIHVLVGAGVRVELCNCVAR